MIKVTYRDKQWEVPGRRAVRDVILAVGFNPATVLAVRKGQPAFVLPAPDCPQLIPVIA
jgi:hypothetical protein